MARKRARTTPPYKYQTFVEQMRRGSCFGVFIDDTGSPGLPSDPEFLHPERKSWVAVVVPPEQLSDVMRQFPRELQELRKQTGACEFHFTDIYAGRGEFRNISLGIRLSLFRFMAGIFFDYGFPVLVQTLDPTNARSIKDKGGFPDRVGPFNLNRHQDMALLFLLLRIKFFLEKSRDDDDIVARVFVDEGYKPNGAAIPISAWKEIFADGLICFARSNVILPLQLADFAAFCLNRTQLILGKQDLCELDKEFLNIISPIVRNYQNIPAIYLEDWCHDNGRLLH